MSYVIPSRYAGLIGLGLMYLWGATLTGWVGWSQSDVLLVKVVAIVGMLLASASGISTFLYVNDLEVQLRKLRETSEFFETQAKEWMDQSQLAISLLEKERAANGRS